VKRLADNVMPTNLDEFSWRTYEDGRREFMFVCPGNHGPSVIPIQPPHPKGWTWDGNEDKPTLNPSIHCMSCGWHGFMRNGELTLG
jgi:hypothetical protein